MRIRIFKQALLHMTTPLLRHPFVCSHLVCFQHQSDLVFCSNPFILIVCPYCCVLRIEWSGGNGTSLLPPPLGGFRFRVLDRSNFSLNMFLLQLRTAISSMGLSGSSLISTVPSTQYVLVFTRVFQRNRTNYIDR